MRFFQSIDVLSVPTTYREPKGLYILEAWANGVPVVQPRHGTFPELIEQTGGGLLVEPEMPTHWRVDCASMLEDHDTPRSDRPRRRGRGSRAVYCRNDGSRSRLGPGTCRSALYTPDMTPFTTTRRVEFADTDTARIVHFANFFRLHGIGGDWTSSTPWVFRSRGERTA